MTPARKGKGMEALEREMCGFVDSFLNGTVTDAKRKRVDAAIRTAHSASKKRKGRK